ncbi:hypothetical protein A9Q99_16725 [Gammaproteobacteria bacterium 45_16_T64]|nr:hypothetical protein A9Q99_16725 [Gammaproteobacteria bacterium 45_16_T64]
MINLKNAMFIFVLMVVCISAKASELNSIIVDKTLSHKGQEFYQEFSMAWEEYSHELQYVLVMSESRSARGGHVISVSYNHRVLFQTSMSRSPDYSKLASEASNNVRYQVQQVVLQMLASGSPDLSDDEI